MKNILIYFSFFYCIIFFVGCNYDSKTEVVVLNDTTKKENFITTDAKINSDSIIVFTNMEQIEYCLPLPLNEYIEDYDKNDVRAKHVFMHKTKKANEITVQGMFRDDPTVSIEDYFKNSYENAEEEGKIITKKEILKNNNCFYAKGYWSNSIYEMRFIEIVWLKKDEMVKFYSSFDVNDSLIWNSRLQTLINSNSNCN